MGSGFSCSYLDDEKGLDHGGSSRTGLEGVPEMCLAVILGYLEPPEICKSAMLNKTFHRASSADFVWESKLPDNYQILFNKLKTSSSTSFNNFIKKDIYAFLSAPNRFGPGFTKEVWLEKKKGGVCISISWKGLKITGIDDRRYWNHLSSDESRFKSIAYLQQTWWLEVAGDLEFEFPAGIYSLFFRLQLSGAPKGHERRGTASKTVHGWDIKPVHFKLSTSDDQHAVTSCHLSKLNTWVYHHVGDFLVQNSNVATKIKFSMSQIDCTHTKGGLCLDSVFICPSELGQRIKKY
ncbi:F-box protein PP2-A13-like [Apium graveolens]|uniref:F-box protein PP2-A13-like n=1 Tax=Apium graveolens TaxID=4045 RepID=UPI003D7B937F